MHFLCGVKMISSFFQEKSFQLLRTIMQVYQIIETLYRRLNNIPSSLDFNTHRKKDQMLLIQNLSWKMIFFSLLNGFLFTVLSSTQPVSMSFNNFFEWMVRLTAIYTAWWCSYSAQKEAAYLSYILILQQLQNNIQ